MMDTEDVTYIIDIISKMKKLEMTVETIKTKVTDSLGQLGIAADKLDSMGDDLMDAGVPGYGISLKNEAKKLRAIMGVLQ